MLFCLISVRPTQFPKDLKISLSSDSYWRTFFPPKVLISDQVFFFLASSYSCQAKLMPLETQHKDPLNESHIHLVIQVIPNRCTSLGLCEGVSINGSTCVMMELLSCDYSPWTTPSTSISLILTLEKAAFHRVWTK